MANTETMVFFALMFSLLASSITISWIANDYAKSPPCGIGSECAPINLDLRQTTPYSEDTSYQDYRDPAKFDANLTHVVYAIGGTYGAWTQGTGGYQLTTATLNIFGWQLGKDPTIILKNLVPIGGTYTVDYVIDNTPAGPFYLLPRCNDLGQITAIAPSTVAIVFDNVGIKVPGNNLHIGDLVNIPFPQAQVTKAGGSTFHVEYNDDTHYLKVQKDGATLIDQTGLDINQPQEIASPLYYGGVSSNTVGFKLVSTTAKRSTISQAQNAGQSFIDGIIDWVDTQIPGAKQILFMLSLITQVIAWTLPEAIFPLWANLLLIKTQAVALIYIGSRLARGGG